MRQLHGLDLFCGAGGATRGYQMAGFEMTGVDIKPQPRYVGEYLVQADALEYVAEHGHEYDFIHASPPCQRFTAYGRRAGVRREDHPDLIAATRESLRAVAGLYVIENIKGAPLDNPAVLCGSTFGLDVQRHRYFETSFPMLVPPCSHFWQTPRFPQATNRSNLRRTVEVGAWRAASYAPAAMGIDWMTNDELSQAIPPAYTEFIGEELLWHLEGAA